MQSLDCHDGYMNNRTLHLISKPVLSSFPDFGCLLASACCLLSLRGDLDEADRPRAARAPRRMLGWRPSSVFNDSYKGYKPNSFKQPDGCQETGPRGSAAAGCEGSQQLSFDVHVQLDQGGDAADPLDSSIKYTTVQVSPVASFLKKLPSETGCMEYDSKEMGKHNSSPRTGLDCSREQQQINHHDARWLCSTEHVQRFGESFMSAMGRSMSGSEPELLSRYESCQATEATTAPQAAADRLEMALVDGHRISEAITAAAEISGEAAKLPTVFEVYTRCTLQVYRCKCKLPIRYFAVSGPLECVYPSAEWLVEVA